MSIEITRSLLATELDSYSDESHARKQCFHADGKKFLKALAKEISVAGQCDIHSNQGGMAVSGEVTLHANSLYVQLFESGKPGIRVLYRSCQGRKDYSGGTNHYVSMKELYLNPKDLADFIELCTDIARDSVTS
jgi:hypothetical protein